jgi:hypothetical protein
MDQRGPAWCTPFIASGTPLADDPEVRVRFDEELPLRDGDRAETVGGTGIAEGVRRETLERRTRAEHVGTPVVSPVAYSFPSAD